MKEFLNTGWRLFKEGFLPNLGLAAVGVLFNIMFLGVVAPADMVKNYISIFMVLFVLDIVGELIINSINVEK